jgi:hypothetical protein
MAGLCGGRKSPATRTQTRRKNRKIIKKFFSNVIECHVLMCYTGSVEICAEGFRRGIIICAARGVVNMFCDKNLFFQNKKENYFSFSYRLEELFSAKAGFGTLHTKTRKKNCCF